MACSWSNISDNSSGMQLTIFSLMISTSLIETLIIPKPITIATDANAYLIWFFLQARDSPWPNRMLNFS